MNHRQGLGWGGALAAALALAGSSLAQSAAPARPQSAAPVRPPLAQIGQAVDLNLVLAVDSSGSVDDDRFDLQKDGYAKAFLNPRVLNAIRNGNEQAIAVTMVQWTGPTLHVIMVPWTVIRDQRT